MQNAKDTFYITLRDRIASLNPARTIVVRGTSRPGVVAQENELASSFEHQDAFVLRWTETKLDAQSSLPLITMRCEIRYATQGNTGNGGMDRGRLLTAMDAELLAALTTAPQNTQKQHYSAGTPAQPQSTSIFWGDPTFTPMQTDGELLERTATVDVFSYQEAQER